MKNLLPSAAACCIEVNSDSLRAEYQGRTLSLALEREAADRLTARCKEHVVSEIRKLLGRSAIPFRPRVICAIPARGVSLRQFTIPATNPEERKRLVALQVETEFPIPPDELSWGFIPVGDEKDAPPGKEHVLVAAVKKTALQDYRDLFSACGLSPVFTPASLARALLCPPTKGRFGHLSLGGCHSELLTLDDAVPTSLRALNWGAAAFKQPDPRLLDPLRAAGQRLYLSSSDAVTQPADLANVLSTSLGFPCDILPGNGSAAIAGIQAATARNVPLLKLNSDAEPRKSGSANRAPFKWAAAAALLVLLAALFPYAEAFLRKPALIRKLGELKADRGRLAVIDRQLDFLRTLKQNQPPYLDALYLISRATPQGARFDSVSMNRRGELALRGSMRDASQVADFRAKLLDTGMFSNLAVEDQSPTPDRQKLMLRITALWKADGMRALAEPLAEKEPARPNLPSGPGMSMPGGMPSGMPMPMPMGLPPGVSLSMPPGMSSSMPPGVMPGNVTVLPGGAMPRPPSPAGMPSPLSSSNAGMSSPGSPSDPLNPPPSTLNPR